MKKIHDLGGYWKTIEGNTAESSSSVQKHPGAFPLSIFVFSF